MKNVKFLCGMLIAIVSLFNCSCSKDSANSIEIQKNNGQSIRDKMFETKISDFIKKCNEIKNSRIQENTDSIDQDSAIWIIQAALNYAYAYPDLTFEHLRTDSDTIVLYRDQLRNLVSFNEAVSSYWNTHSSLKSFYNTIVSNDKKLISVRLTKIEEIDNKIILSINAKFGTEKITSPPNGLFPMTAIFYGACNSTTKAPDALTQSLNWHANNVTPPNGFRYAYTYYGTWSWIPPYDPLPGNFTNPASLIYLNTSGSTLIGVGPTDDPTCFTQADYQKYYLGAITLANNNNPQPGSAFDIPKQYTITGENYNNFFVGGNIHMTWVSRHTIDVNYYTRYLVSCPTCCNGCPVEDTRDL